MGDGESHPENTQVEQAQDNPPGTETAQDADTVTATPQADEQAPVGGVSQPAPDSGSAPVENSGTEANN